MKNLLLAIVVSLASLLPIHAAYDVYLKFEGANISKGDSMDETYRGEDGWFNITNFSLGMKTDVTVGGGGGGITASRVRFERVGITKKAGMGSAQLLMACATGNHFQKVTLVIVNSTGKIMQADFHNVVFESVKSVGSDGDETLNEDIVFAHGAQRMEFFKQDPKTGATVSLGASEWSVITNTATTGT